MLRGAFGRVAGSLGIATGTLGVVALTGNGGAVILNALAATLWVFVVGWKLTRSATVSPKA